MAKLKTVYTDADVEAFIRSFASSGQQIADSHALVGILSAITGEKPRMWGPSIIGFGTYHYKYKSGHEGDAPVLGFSPRKTALSLYVYSDTERSRSLLAELGKFKMGKACIHVKKLEDINREVLREICLESVRYIAAHHTCSCRGTG